MPAGEVNQTVGQLRIVGQITSSTRPLTPHAGPAAEAAAGGG